jgi:hypothetical protein
MAMETYRDREFQGKSFHLDDVVFVNCKLTGCDLFYSGGDFEIVNCRVEACQFHWRGPAKNTLAMLHMMEMLKTAIRERENRL